MKRLVIIGAGGFGREVLEWATNCADYRREWEISGFLDDQPDALAGFPEVGLPVLGNTTDYVPRDDECFVCAIGKPELRATIRQRFEEKGARFARVIHESCLVGRRVELGEGVILCPEVVVTTDIRIGTNTAVNVATAVGHDVEIGSDCQISSFCDITGHVKLGDRVLCGSRVSVIPGRTVGNGATLGAGSVVVTDVPPDITVFGNPAQILTHHQ